MASGAGPAASAFLTQSERPPASQPSPRATSVYVVPDFLYSSTAFCLNSAVYLGDGLPMLRLASLRWGNDAETEIRLSTDLGQIQIHACDVAQHAQGLAAPGRVRIVDPLPDVTAEDRESGSGDSAKRSSSSRLSRLSPLR